MARGIVGNRQLFLFKNYVEHVPKEEKIDKFVPRLARGIYILFNEVGDKKMNVVYIGRSTVGEKQGVGARLVTHKREKKGWSHYSVFEVWQNLSNEIIEELEALILHFVVFAVLVDASGNIEIIPDSVILRRYVGEGRGPGICRPAADAQGRG
jgi:hypothetical protein